MTDRTDLLLVTPPLLQPNTPYPAAAYLTGYLRSKGLRAVQYDLSVELLNAVFTREFLLRIFDGYAGSDDPAVDSLYRMRRSYLRTVGPVMEFLRTGDVALAHLITGADFLPQGARFEAMEDLAAAYGTAGTVDCARYLSTLYLEDLSDFIRATADPHFALARYAERIALSVPSFEVIEQELRRPVGPVGERMLELLEEQIRTVRPARIGFTVPFPGNLLAALRCGRYVRENYPEIVIVMGGGYPSTELRSMTDPGIFGYTDYLVLDDGEGPLEQIVTGRPPVNTYTYAEGKIQFTPCKETFIPHGEKGCPDYSDLDFSRYFSLADTSNPMQRLWSDGKWIKLAAAHGCYWAKCAFCDTSLDYIRRYDPLDAAALVDRMEELMRQTGQNGFHLVDEAAPPKLLKEMALEILRRGLSVSWWGNIRFEPAFTADLCQLLAASGCIAVSGGIETASDRLLTRMNKGISIEKLTVTLRNFYYAGILVHGYLMYGFPTQTLQETVDSLEIVRQLFRAELLTSAFWHRYAMTVHSPSRELAGEYGVRIKRKEPHPFANNEIPFTETRDYDINVIGEGLRTALFHYFRGAGIEKPAHKWLGGKAPATTVEDTEITDHLIKPDASRIFDGKARLVWIGNDPVRTAEGVVFYGNAKEKAIRLADPQADFLMKIIPMAADLTRKTDFTEVCRVYAEFCSEPFLYFYHGKKWDQMRGFGLLQV